MMKHILQNHQIIAIDCDEILVALVEVAMKRAPLHIQEKISDVEKITDYYVHQCIDISLEEAIELFRVPLREDAQKFEIPTIPGSYDCLKAWKEQDKNLQIVTARNEQFDAYTRKYIEKHFPGIFVGYHFASHFSERPRKKGEICQDIGATLLVEDNLDYALEAAEKGIKVLLMNKPWNIHREETHENIKRFDDWCDLI